mmetsp:Transcript_27946/g.61144  ORF Transcript_27946/g.61144 Transcript_27946/m.61144 type:complete len:90 (-) Transcript_27946:30-299(-)
MKVLAPRLKRLIKAVVAMSGGKPENGEDLHNPHGHQPGAESVGGGVVLFVFSEPPSIRHSMEVGSGAWVSSVYLENTCINEVQHKLAPV